jgi:bifunctional non-homologous end joining protein LigD
MADWKLDVGGRALKVTHPDKVYFAEAGITKGDLVRYYEAVADGAVRQGHHRPMILKRFVKGIAEKPFFQKRAPDKRPDWIARRGSATPSGGVADEVVLEDPATLLYIVNLGCVDIKSASRARGRSRSPGRAAHRSRSDPRRSVSRRSATCAMVCKAVLDEHRLVGWPKTSGSKGFHIFVRIERRWEFTDVRHAGLALAREVEKRMPGIATAPLVEGGARRRLRRLQPERARSHDVLRVLGAPDADARVSAPLHWDEGAHVRSHVVHAPHDARAVRAARRSRGRDRRRGGHDRLAARALRGAGEGGRGKKRVADKPMLVVGQSVDEKSALAGLERWKARHPDVVAKMWERDFLVDNMRGRSSTWTRIRVNLEHVPEELRPEQEALDPDEPPDWGRTGRRPGWALRASQRAPNTVWSSTGGAFSICSKVQSSGACRTASGGTARGAGTGRPSKWLYFTSTTRSIRTDSQLRSLPAFQRLVMPGSAEPTSCAISAQPAQG